MLIAIDGVAANDKERVGVSVYTYELLKYFHEEASKDRQFVIYLKDKPRSDLPAETEYFRYKVVPGPFLWSRIFFPLALLIDKKPDVFFAPAHYLPPFVPCSSVVTIHDLAYEYFPNEFLKKDLYKLKNWTKSAVQKAKKVIAVSDNTKKDIVKFYNVPENKIKIIYNGFSKKVTKTAANEIRANNLDELLQSNYFLYVGTIQPRKNIKALIEAFNSFIKEKPEFNLIIVGKKGWLYDEIFETVKKLQLEKKVIFTGYLLDGDVATLYKNAQAFILPSLYEGFGIPVLEAMSYDCPVLTSRVSSLPEVGGSACLYFDPNDTIDMKNKMIEIIADKNKRKDLIERGRQRIKQFSWEKCAQDTLKVLTSL